MKTNTANKAKRELDILSITATDPENRPIIEPFAEEILALCEKFGNSGQSGGSAPYTATAITQALKKLLLQEPICPITGIDEEWNNIREMSEDDEMTHQNNRCSAIFKGNSGKCWYLDAIIWKEVNGSTYYGRATTRDGKNYHSQQYLKGFPFTPKTFYIDVVRETLPEDWTEEPFIEYNDYDTQHYLLTGEKIWQTHKYRNVIKDASQLKKVFKYYNEKPY